MINIHDPHPLFNDWVALVVSVPVLEPSVVLRVDH